MYWVIWIDADRGYYPAVFTDEPTAWSVAARLSRESLGRHVAPEEIASLERAVRLVRGDACPF